MYQKEVQLLIERGIRGVDITRVSLMKNACVQVRFGSTYRGRRGLIIPGLVFPVWWC